MNKSCKRMNIGNIFHGVSSALLREFSCKICKSYQYSIVFVKENSDF